MKIMMFMQIVHRILELTSEFVSMVEVVNQKDDGSSIDCICFVCLFLLLLLVSFYWYIPVYFQAMDIDKSNMNAVLDFML